MDKTPEDASSKRRPAATAKGPRSEKAPDGPARDEITFLFSGYARLPQDVSHQAIYKRVGVVVEVGADGVILDCSTTLMMDVAREFFGRLLLGHSVLTERRELEALIRYRYRGHSQAALISALHKVFEAVDQSPLVEHGEG